MPIPDLTCESTPGCTVLYEVTQSVVQVAYDAVMKVIDPSLCDSFTGLVTHGEPHHPAGDYVAGWIVGIGARDRNQNNAAGLMFPVMTAEIGVKMVESGYPTISGDGPPPFEMLAAAALHSYGHVEAVARAIFANVGRGGPHRILRDCGWQGMSTWRPIQPSGGLVGWTFTVSLTVPT